MSYQKHSTHLAMYRTWATATTSTPNSTCTQGPGAHSHCHCPRLQRRPPSTSPRRRLCYNSLLFVVNSVQRLNDCTVTATHDVPRISGCEMAFAKGECNTKGLFTSWLAFSEFPLAILLLPLVVTVPPPASVHCSLRLPPPLSLQIYHSDQAKQTNCNTTSSIMFCLRVSNKI